MDAVLREDSTETTARLKWRASRLGGRTIASPSATPGAMAAARRRGRQVGAQLDFLTEVTLLGEIGREDGVVIRLLMDHLAGAVGLRLTETDYARDPRAGEYVHLASQDPLAQPGRVRLLLGSQEDVRRVYAGLHGQTLQVGADLVGIAVANDAVDAVQRPGNGQGGQGP